LGLYIWIKDDYCIICLQEVTFEVLFLDKWSCAHMWASFHEAVCEIPFY
jgi:hypothetical protein